MFKTALAVTLFTLVLTGAGCFGGSTTNQTNQKGKTNTAQQQTKEPVEEGVPDLSKESSKEDYDAVIEDLESLSDDLEGMDESNGELEKSSAEL
ncbi:MAG: hypothetical protein UU48_C0004G0004 [Candidatus Uhrbacteria bacterium GW2011_GWF2_41_16]|jgi:hypothetical protein|uniref:Lipoprotein n=2 Tax=Candidatus Uhriibacteriota TaxID=1752732 RepID=A0A0G0VEY6_9BACT|nr:MAG: hypothetical protein UU31_C0008G0011 [Candidatus Uhrbacteria bacterium GW2011_GWA2_41_10]KKR86645.1 MAG: hypothetical protein UU35_C0010G0023 [Candidatus Uhrbacteria bacterium GW2011_GWC2_41_11]KKR98211.1 MAG: hypothetical protein UU48_C0004G0004 [Candidatus Uhrbacteria bacterium GW2011_GWF2_41_16]HBP00539.1 hypothetical protein [Candidatus Uhrbacteria bacterium]